MKVLVFGGDTKAIEPLVISAGLEIVKTKPEAIISYGGDGTLLRAEHEFPGIPKVLLRGSKICKRCSPFNNEELLQRVASGKYAIEERCKLEVETKGMKKQAVNDIIVHNKEPRRPMRYRVWINDKQINGELIGDGIVAATPYGSTAYYRSITDSFFEVGIGLAFNNSTEQADHMVLSEDSVIKIKIVRGPTLVYADNQEETIELAKDDEIVIKKSPEKFNLIKV